MVLAIEKLILFGICLAVFLPGLSSAYDVVLVIAAVFVSALNSWLERDLIRYIGFGLFLAACIPVPGLLYFLPLISFDVFFTRGQLFVLLCAIPLAYHFQAENVQMTLLVVFLLLLAWFIKWRGMTLERLHRDMVVLRDSTREMTLQLEDNNKELMEKQDYEVNLATLNERNRIAREIHDQVGHLLTRAILQIGAVQAASHEPQMREPLTRLKETLAESMDSIRNSLHDLHDPIIDLQAELRALVRDFRFCPIQLDYDVGSNLDKRIKYAFLAIIREGLANVMRHSNATQVDVTLREHPGLYQLIIKDNGTQGFLPDKNNPGEGIGLKSMADRVRSLNGQFNIKREQGFVLFITVPKEHGSTELGSEKKANNTPEVVDGI